MQQSRDGEAPPKKPRSTPTTGHVTDDGILIELLYDPERRHTALVVCRGGKWTVEPTVMLPSGERLTPYSPGNPLIRHQVVVLPSEPVEYGSTATLAAEIRSYIRRYVDLSPAFETAAVTYVLLSWVYDAFNELPYLRVRGDYGSGKTRFLLVIGALAYKAFFGSGASTVSPLFHIQDAFRGTLVLDEADFRLSDEKAEVVKILNNGNVAGMPVLRTMQNGKGELQPRAFQVFGPKVLASRGTYEDQALESRFLTEAMGGRPLRQGIPINLPDAYRDEARALRNKLLVYRFRNRHSAAIDPSLIDDALEARRNQVLVPLLSMAPDGAARAAIGELSQQETAGEGESIKHRLADIVRDLIAADPDKHIPIAAITSALRSSGAPSYANVEPRYVGALVRRVLGLPTAKRHGIYVIPHDQAATLLAQHRTVGSGDRHVGDVSRIGEL